MHFTAHHSFRIGQARWLDRLLSETESAGLKQLTHHDKSAAQWDVSCNSPSALSKATASFPSKSSFASAIGPNFCDAKMWYVFMLSSAHHEFVESVIHCGAFSIIFPAKSKERFAVCEVQDLSAFNGAKPRSLGWLDGWHRDHHGRFQQLGFPAMEALASTKISGRRMACSYDPDKFFWICLNYLWICSTDIKRKKIGMTTSNLSEVPDAQHTSRPLSGIFWLRSWFYVDMVPKWGTIE